MDDTWTRNNKQKTRKQGITIKKLLLSQNIRKLDSTQNEDETKILNRTEEIQFVILKKVNNEVNNNLSSRKAQGFDIITGKILEQLFRKGIIKLCNIINAAFRIKRATGCYKNQVNVTLLHIMSKLFEELYLKRLKKKNLIPNQFGFRHKHVTIKKLNIIFKKALEGKEFCSRIFIGGKKPFNKEWHKGFIQKLNKILPKQHVNLFTSCINNR